MSRKLFDKDTLSEVPPTLGVMCSKEILQTFDRVFFFYFGTGDVYGSYKAKKTLN